MFLKACSNTVFPSLLLTVPADGQAQIGANYTRPAVDARSWVPFWPLQSLTARLRSVTKPENDEFSTLHPSPRSGRILPGLNAEAGGEWTRTRRPAVNSHHLRQGSQSERHSGVRGDGDWNRQESPPQAR